MPKTKASKRQTYVLNIECYCFSTPTMVTLTCLRVTLYVHWLS